MELGKIVESSAEFYVDSRVCIRVGNDESEWFPVKINQLLFTDDTALVGGSEQKLCRLVSEFG